MITNVNVYSDLPVDDLGFLISIDWDKPIETDYIQILNIEGLGPVKASISLMDSGSKPGQISLGSSIPARNIVLTLRPNPDWITWTPEQLSQVIYAYFTPEHTVQLDFWSEELDTTASITGIVESCEPNRFSKDPEYIISILCPDPYFTLGEIQNIEHPIAQPESWTEDGTQYPALMSGNAPVGFKLKVGPIGFSSDLIFYLGGPGSIFVPYLSTFRINYDMSGKIIELNTIPGERYLRLIDPDTGSYISILDAITSESIWPVFAPGGNRFALMTADETEDPGNFELTYRERYGSI